MPDKKLILHFVTPLKNVSPFDVNMAADAGFDVVVPYSDVDLKEVAGLVQDAIFSRAPARRRRTAVLIGGREPMLALDMLEAAEAGHGAAAFRDLGDGRPVGRLHHRRRHDRRGREAPAGQGCDARGPARWPCSAPPGPVGKIAGLIAAQAGARVTLVGYDGLQRVTAAAEAIRRALRGGDDARRRQRRGQEAGRDRRCRGDPGRGPRRHADPEQGPARHRQRPLVALDVNAVPPAGLEGVGAFDDGTRDRRARRASASARSRSATSSSRPSTSCWPSMRDAEPRRYHRHRRGVRGGEAACRWLSRS